jgi:uncharacterized protein
MKKTKDPCISICQYDENEICSGCSRTKSEAKSWWRLTEEEKMKIMENIVIREKEKNENYDHYI